MTIRVLLIALSISYIFAGDNDHAHGTDKFEWAGIFETPENVYMWTAQKVANKYADPAMKLVALPASAATEQALHALENQGSHAMELTCEQVQAGGIIKPMENKCYTLNFKQDWWQSLFTIDATGMNHIAFFAEHVPTEFENTAHYLKDDHGDDIEPLAELPEAVAASSSSNDKDTPWGAALVAAFLVNIVTLVGVVFMVPFFSKMSKEYAAEFEGLMSAFAAGALLACAFFLLLFEATHLIAVGHKEEVAVIWRWGVMILAGFMLPACIQVVADGGLAQKAVVAPEPVGVVVGEKTIKSDAAESEAGASTKARLIAGVLIGDFFHNLCDGLFIGAAFKGCGTSFGWNVSVGTIAHELGQELSDYVILTGSTAKLSPLHALVLNFFSGLSVILGVIIVLANDVSDTDIGLLLAFGGGVYLHIGATECMPRVYNEKLKPWVRALCLLMFIFGTFVIGLVLVDHDHCVPDSDGDSGGSHAHDH